MKTLYISDMDGTLLASDSRLTQRSRDIITDLTRRGALITVATARTPATVMPLLAGVETTPPAIVMTGAALWNRRLSSMEHIHYIKAADYSFITATCRQCGVEPFVYTTATGRFLDVYHSAGLSLVEQGFVAPRAALALKKFHFAGTPAACSDAVLLFAIGERGAIEKCAATLMGREDRCSVSCYPDIFNPAVALMEVFAPGVSKASAVALVKELTGAQRVVAFGDNLNDLPMLEVADVAVAVGNAFDEVKQAADVVIGSNGSDAVARFIQDDFDIYCRTGS